MTDNIGIVFFITGSQRSGTTLLRLILDPHPDLVVYDEDQAYWRLTKHDFPGDENTGFKVPMLTAQYREIIKQYPAGKFLFVTRDTRAIASSILGLWERGGHAWCNGGLNDLKRSLEFVSSKDLELGFRNLLAEFENDWLAIAVIFAHVKGYYFLQEYTKNTMEVSYEKLVKDPKAMLVDITNFLGISWSDNLLKHSAFHEGIQVGNTDAARGIDPASLEKWRSRCKEEDIAKIEGLISRMDSLVKDHNQ